MKKKNIPLSKMAKIDLMFKNSGNDFLPILFIILSGLTLLTLSMLIPTLGREIPFGYWIGLGVSIVVFSISLGFIFKIKRQNKRQIMEENLEDWELAQKINSLTDYLQNNPPDFKKHGSTALLKLSGLTPVRIDYASNSQIAGEISGTMKGIAFIVFRGTFEGKMHGESTPELTEQHAVVLCVDKKGDSFRLIFPSSATLRRNMEEYVLMLANGFGVYGTKSRSYAGEAVIRLWNEFLRDTLSRLNHQRIIDFLATRLSLPSGEKPNIAVYGSQIKEGTIIVASIECGKRGIETVVPIDLMNDIKSLFKAKTNVELPPIPLLGSGD